MILQVTHSIGMEKPLELGNYIRMRATAYLDGYQNYPKSKKAPDNLLKLGITMVQLGEKDQGCKMIISLKKEYPKASKSVLQKAQYEQKNSSVILKEGFKGRR